MMLFVGCAIRVAAQPTRPLLRAEQKPAIKRIKPDAKLKVALSALRLLMTARHAPASVASTGLGGGATPSGHAIRGPWPAHRLA